MKQDWRCLFGLHKWQKEAVAVSGTWYLMFVEYETKCTRCGKRRN